MSGRRKRLAAEKETHSKIRSVTNIIMDEKSFEGTLVLEKLARIDKVEDFFEAIDSDNFSKAKALMKEADIDSGTIAIVLKKMIDNDDDH